MKEIEISGPLEAAKKTAPEKTYIVGVGASAGGLEAITQLINHLSIDTPCAYVVLQHLSPTYRSMMVEILSRETLLRVQDAEHGTIPQAGHIYVVPANFNAHFKEGRIALVTAQPEISPKPSVNQFLISLAAEEGESAIGIVLSGTGSDGVAGLRAIQAAGGYTFAQKPETAKYDGMPRSAIEAGVADHILSPEDIALKLPQLLEGSKQELENTLPADLLSVLLEKVRSHLQHDFSGYKVGTLIRRIRRREVATGSKDLAAYIQWVDAHPQELELLVRDILISVTAFFRDKDAFEALKRAIAEICNRKPAGSEIRIWTAGCATGEEAYSIAMLFSEALGDKLPLYKLQIFATDIDEEALNVARRGVYPAGSMAEVPTELIERYFQPVNRAFEAGKLLRDLIIFARHNLVSDPPFLRQDLITCRNVLIYFDASLQAKVLQTFHFGLLPDGYLFLGHSESVAHAEQMFIPVNRPERLFRKTGAGTPFPVVSSNPRKNSVARSDLKQTFILDGLVNHFGLTVALCDSDGNVIHTAGKVEEYLQFPVGNTRLVIGQIVSASLRGELLSLTQKLNKSGKAQRGRLRKHDTAHVRMYVEPIKDTNNQMMLVIFVPEKKVTIDAEPVPSTPNRELEDELVATREHLQTLVEEMATANEEMQGLNEEAQVSNEELQATNEEMEAANEELQATNEELVSLNEEMIVKTTEMSRLSEEYAHLYDSLQFPIMVFDRSFQLTRFNGPAARRFDLRPTALRQHLSSLRLPKMFHDLEQSLVAILAHGDREEKIVHIDGRTLNLMVNPGINKAGDVTNIVVILMDVTDITQAQAELKQSQEHLHALMENTSILFAMKDLRGSYVYANRRFIDFFHLTEFDFLGRSDFDLMSRELASMLWEGDLKALREGKAVQLESVATINETIYHLRTNHQVLLDARGNPSVFIIEAEDISALKAADEQLRITAQVFEHAGEAIAVTDSQAEIQSVNYAFTGVTGYTKEEAIGQHIEKLLQSGQHPQSFCESMWQSVNDSGFWQGEISNKRKNGDLYPAWLTINQIKDNNGHVEHFVAVFSDITAIRDNERKAEFLASHDALTKLPNRTLFQDRLRQALLSARRNNQRIALLFIDLDNFKSINDTLGHDYGDELLKEAALRLREVLRGHDTVARMGGDEFTAILTNCDEEAATQIASRIINDLAMSYNVMRHQLFVSASIGIAFYPEDSNNSTDLIKAADSAMYRAKEDGRNRFEFFKQEMHTRLLRKSTIESGLRNALAKNLLEVVYQPKYSITDSKQLVGGEALLRWEDPDLGVVSPQDFIPIAESSGLIGQVTEYVLDSVCTQISQWEQSGIKTFSIAVNISARDLLVPGFAYKLIQVIEQYQLGTGAIMLEITEGSLLDNNANVFDNLKVASENGIAISIDDFGTGYSSLSYLKRLPLSELKIDKSFVNGLGQDKEDEAITLAIISLASALGLKTVAEGVETQAQLAWLEQQGCHMAQGYLLSKPLPLSEFEDLLARTASSCCIASSEMKMAGR